MSPRAKMDRIPDKDELKTIGNTPNNYEIFDAI